MRIRRSVFLNHEPRNIFSSAITLVNDFIADITAEVVSRVGGVDRINHIGECLKKTFGVLNGEERKGRGSDRRREARINDLDLEIIHGRSEYRATRRTIIGDGDLV